MRCYSLLAGAVVVAFIAHPLQGDGPTIAPDRLLGASDALPFDGLGYGLAVDSNRMLVGARGSDSVALNAGVLYSYTRGSAGWTQLSKVIFPQALANDQVGTALAVSGTVAVAGAPNRGSSGAVFALKFDGGAWFPTGELSDATASSDARFGSAVAASPSMIAVGAHGSSEGIAWGVGRVLVFDRVGAQWIAGQTIRAPYLDPGDQFGFAVALDGEWLAVSAPGDDDNDTINAGAVYLYRLVGGVFSLAHKVRALTPRAEDSFGYALSLKGNTLVIGAPRRDDAASNAGAAYVFQISTDGASVAHLRTLLPPAGSVEAEFGFSVSTDGTGVVVGAPGMNTGESLGGAAWLYLDSTATSTAVLMLPVSGMQLLGTRVAMTTSDVIASVPAASNGPVPNAGRVAVHDRARDCNVNGVADSIDLGAGVSNDSNQDGTPDECQCLIDLNADGFVNGVELATILANWGPVPASNSADINDDGVVNGFDLAIVLSAWGPCSN